MLQWPKSKVILQKGFSNFSKEDEFHLEQLSKAAEAWELKEYPMPTQPLFPDILFYVMQHKRVFRVRIARIAVFI